MSAYVLKLKKYIKLFNLEAKTKTFIQTILGSGKTAHTIKILKIMPTKKIQKTLVE